MSITRIPKGYTSKLSLYETQEAIDLIKVHFSNHLKKALNLKRVSAPLFVLAGTGINDDLNGVERPVSFDLMETGQDAQVVQSLAKWKRLALWRYGFPLGEGLYTDMNAIRRDEELTNLHSVYVDQWDWEKVISEEQRSIPFLKETVRSIVGAIVDTLEDLRKVFPQIPTRLSRDVSFVTSQELEDLYPDMTPKERENAYLKKHPTTFVMQIGDVLKSGQKHDGRAPDYDDWALNGDIVFWSDLLERAFEVSSMGIRVDQDSLLSQLEKADCMERKDLPFHKALLSGVLPLSMGGGIGQSRLCMLLLGKAHIGEVQCGIWDDKTRDICEAAGITLL
ncbi:MAG: aspartate--ammonia ligase [Clostridiales bacterium]|nr:aspartate--ammonia ligase [Clostridiales bacterium]